MFIVGLTGGIGSGKSTAAKLFADLGVAVIDADKIAHQLTAKNSPALTKIFNHFGQAVINPDQSLNRAALSDIIFNDGKQKKWLEDYLHPQVITAMLQQAKKTQSDYCIFVIPLLVEAQLQKIVDRILVIDAPDELQIERTVARDKKTEAQVITILKSQSSRQAKLAIADDVISNEGSLDDLRTAVYALHQKYLNLKD